MSYLAFARKWRPGRFEDLVGQQHVSRTLKNAIEHDRLAHAYLFCGARGVGKTSVARIFAKTLRCAHKVNGSPCETCEECLAISEGKSVDVVEIDGASNNGVEAVRAIRENVVYGASSGQFKIYIIDEVHMLSLSAFNALLKTLEEPPEHIKFLFATTEPQKIPVTILSRCQRFEFRRLTHSEIIGQLEKIMASEKVTASPEALRVLASSSDGSLRDALSLLDQCLSYWSQKNPLSLDETEVVEALGLNSQDQISLFLEHIISNRPASLIAIVEEVYTSGSDFKYFTQRLLEECRALYLVKLSENENKDLLPESLDLTASHLESLKKLAQKASVVQIERLAQLIAKTKRDLAHSTLPQFLMEMAAVRMCQLGDLKTHTLLASESMSQANYEKKKQEVPSKPVASPSPTPAIQKTPTAPIPQTQPQTKDWTSFVAFVVGKRPLLGALLSHANFKVEKKENHFSVTLAYSTDSFYEKQIQDKQNRKDIQSHLLEFFGSDTEISFSNQMNETQKSLETQKEVFDAKTRKEALEHPEVLKVKELMGAEIVDISLGEH